MSEEQVEMASDQAMDCHGNVYVWLLMSPECQPWIYKPLGLFWGVALPSIGLSMIIIIWGYLGITPQTNKPWFILNVLTHTHSCRLCPFLKKPTAAWIQPNLSNLGRSNPENKNPGIILAIICSDAIHIYNMILYIYIHICTYIYIYIDIYGLWMTMVYPCVSSLPHWSWIRGHGQSSTVPRMRLVPVASA